MNGNISKTRGVLGATGPAGPIGPQGEKGDTPSIIFKIDENGNLYYSSDGILAGKEYFGTNYFVSLEEYEKKIKELTDVINKAFPRTVTVILPASAWVEEADREYSQVVSVENVPLQCDVDLRITKEQVAIFSEKDITFWVEAENGVISFSCFGQKPTNDYEFQIKITEVRVDE